MLELVIPRTEEIGACAIYDAAGAHNKLVETFLLSIGRTPLQIMVEQLESSKWEMTRILMAARKDFVKCM